MTPRIALLAAFVTLAACAGNARPPPTPHDAGDDAPTPDAGPTPDTSDAGDTTTPDAGPPVNTDAEDVAAAKAVLDASQFLAPGDTTASVTRGLMLPLRGARGVTLTWYGTDDTITSDGAVTRPPACAADAPTTFVAVLRKGSAGDTKEFALVVTANTPPDAQLVTSAAAAVTLETGADAERPKADFALPTTSTCGIGVTWTSDSPALDVVTAPGTAHVTRALGHDTVASLTATFTRGAASATRTFEFTIPAWGFSAAEFDMLVDRVIGLDQLGGLAMEVQLAQQLVAANPSLLPNATVRAAFLAQDPAGAASEMCTTVARYVYLLAYRMLAPNAVHDLPEHFRDFYVHAVARGQVSNCSTCKGFVWVEDGEGMIRDYASSPADDWTFARGTTYRTDTALITAVQGRRPQLALFRDGPSATEDTHTFTVALHADGTYRMLDTYFLRTWTGKTITPDGGRFGPNNPRYLHTTYGYVDTELPANAGP